MKHDRRIFLRQLAATSGLLALPATNLGQDAPAGPGKRKRLALLGTVVYRHSHAQHFLDRHAMGYPWNGHWQKPRVELASVFIDQFPEGRDLARSRAERYGIELSPDIEHALTLGTGRLAVDGVVIIAEHGDYPDNEKGQRLYPRYEWFKKCVQVFEQSGRAVPIFNDKHLSTSWEQCAEMVADSKRLGFPFLAGSSLPVTRRLPALDLPHGTPLKESVCVAYGGVDSYDIHALETAQCMSERRKGGEVGIRSVLALRDEAMWNHLAAPERADTRRLMVAALNRSHNLPVENGYPTAPTTFEWARANFPNATGYFVEHRDGFRTAIFLVGIQDFNYAGLRADNDEIISCQMYLPMPGHGSTTADFFIPLVRHIEDMILTGHAPYPVERTLLTSGMTLAAVDSLHRGGQVVETPEMDVNYTLGEQSSYWQE